MPFSDEDLGIACPSCYTKYSELAPKRMARGFQNNAKFLNQVLKCANCGFLHSWDEAKIESFKGLVAVEN